MGDKCSIYIASTKCLQMAKIKQFMFASSGSVYGISRKNKVDENTNLLPITDYNKTKMVGEILVKNYQKFFQQLYCAQVLYVDILII